jgi:hypothetical protein
MIRVSADITIRRDHKGTYYILFKLQIYKLTKVHIIFYLILRYLVWVSPPRASSRSLKIATSRNITDLKLVKISEYCSLFFSTLYDTGVHGVMCSKVIIFGLTPLYCSVSRSQRPRGLRRRSAAAQLLRLWVRIPPRTWMFVCP